MSTATESKHTPGPWTPKFLVDSWVVDGPDNRMLLGVYTYEPQAEADARLIAAAPAILEALEEMVAFGKRQGWTHVAINYAEAAIKLAKGEL